MTAIHPILIGKIFTKIVQIALDNADNDVTSTRLIPFGKQRP